MSAKGTLHVLTRKEISIGRDLVNAVIGHDRTEFECLYDAYDLTTDALLRGRMVSLGAKLAFAALDVRRLVKRPPQERERQLILRDLDRGVFSDIVDMSFAYPLLWWACGAKEPIAVKNNDLFAATSIIVGATLLDRETGRWLNTWEHRYALILGMSRHRVGVSSDVRFDDRCGAARHRPGPN